MNTSLSFSDCTQAYINSSASFKYQSLLSFLLPIPRMASVYLRYLLWWQWRKGGRYADYTGFVLSSFKKCVICDHLCTASCKDTTGSIWLLGCYAAPMVEEHYTYFCHRSPHSLKLLPTVSDICTSTDIHIIFTPLQ